MPVCVFSLIAQKCGYDTGTLAATESGLQQQLGWVCDFLLFACHKCMFYP